LIKNSQPFGKIFQKTAGGGIFLTHTVCITTLTSIRWGQDPRVQISGTTALTSAVSVQHWPCYTMVKTRN